MSGVTTQPQPRLRTDKLTVSFGQSDVVSGVDISLSPYEIHAVTGENGAGKSSLAKAIAGVYTPRDGSIRLDGMEVRFRNPREALHAGIALIHQEPVTFPDLSVAENIFAGNAITKRGLVDSSACNTKSAVLLDELGCQLDPKVKADQLSVAQRQYIEIASALTHQARVWIFDETTAALSPKEVSELFGIMRRLRDQGEAIMIVTHHLHEVFEIADRITVLRDGQKVSEHVTSETNPREIVRKMVGREVSTERLTSGPVGACVLDVENLSGIGFSGVNLHVKSGEVVGIAGLVGSGRTELTRALFGITKPSSGEVRLDGKVTRIKSPMHARTLGIALVPEDRNHNGLFAFQSIEFNTTIASNSLTKNAGWINGIALRDRTNQFVQKLNLVYRGAHQQVSELSGGNQQKIVLAKWLMARPKLLIVDEPTRGVDVGAKFEVHRILRELANDGMSVLMISSDLKEILALSDRILVMRDGQIAGEFEPEDATEESIMQLATGQALHA